MHIVNNHLRTKKIGIFQNIDLPPITFPCGCYRTEICIAVQIEPLFTNTYIEPAGAAPKRMAAPLCFIFFFFVGEVK